LHGSDPEAIRQIKIYVTGVLGNHCKEFSVMRIKNFLFLVFCLVAANAQADQAAYISRADAERAVELLKDIGELKSFCAPCDDESVETIVVKRIASGAVGYENFWEVRVNDEGVDLAYIYFPVDGKWRNAAMALKIPVEDVPEFIQAPTPVNLAKPQSGPEQEMEIFCETGEPHAIDIWFAEEMGKTGGRTPNTLDVQNEAYNRWDKELNLVYRELLEKLDDGSKKQLKEAQRAWIAFRDAEFNLLWAEGLYGGVGGTLAPIAVNEARRVFVRQRVCALQMHREVADN
jgi:uncharacterized protein YecT (DUF1311 family)